MPQCAALRNESDFEVQRSHKIYHAYQDQITKKYDLAD